MREVSLTVGALACLALLPSKGEARSRRPELSEYYWQSRTGKEPKALYFTSPDVTEKSEKKKKYPIIMEYKIIL